MAPNSPLWQTNILSAALERSLSSVLTPNMIRMTQSSNEILTLQEPIHREDSTGSSCMETEESVSLLAEMDNLSFVMHWRGVRAGGQSIHWMRCLPGDRDSIRGPEKMGKICRESGFALELSASMGSRL